MPTGSAAKRPGTDVQRRRIRRSDAGIQLMLTGWSWQTIADRLGYASPAYAEKEILEAIAATTTTLDKEQGRRVLNLRYGELYRSVVDKAMDPDSPEQLPAHRAAMSVLERISKLNGWDAPSEVSITSPSQGELMRAVEVLLGAAQGEAADIIDVDPIEGFEEGPDQDELERYDESLRLDRAGEAGDQDRDRGLTGLQGPGGPMPEEARLQLDQ